ncbi:uncharacterized protein CIMG_13150 [Coccidioides immitis RS]|uniref:Uncharacterized protein n=1 Tax=Coccidioides immitis (strain RS) TaxID=246410 RepID=J3KA92_COCIM|nr:uncharacterized protein CIMG_13150 [Coccidioides immitis RS]EAS31916.3 hypothetical protein CIMG_13150 [Coccidioides immitis RS]
MDGCGVIGKNVDVMEIQIGQEFIFVAKISYSKPTHARDFLLSGSDFYQQAKLVKTDSSPKLMMVRTVKTEYGSKN